MSYTELLSTIKQSPPPFYTTYQNLGLFPYYFSNLCNENKHNVLRSEASCTVSIFVVQALCCVFLLDWLLFFQVKLFMKTKNIRNIYNSCIILIMQYLGKDGIWKRKKKHIGWKKSAMVYQTLHRWWKYVLVARASWWCSFIMAPQ